MDEDEGVLLGVMRKLLIACCESEGGLAEVQVLAELLGVRPGAKTKRGQGAECARKKARAEAID